MRIIARSSIGPNPIPRIHTDATRLPWPQWLPHHRRSHGTRAQDRSGEYIVKAIHPPSKTYKFGDKTSKLVRPAKEDNDTKSIFRRALAALQERLAHDSVLLGLRLAPPQLSAQFERFKNALHRRQRIDGTDYAHLVSHFERLAADGEKLALDLELKYAFFGFVASTRLSTQARDDRDRLLEIPHPAEWFPATREIQREIHVHVGPTNSGKTYHALKRLQQADSGVYAGPLRLLAHEVYERLNAQGKSCALVTGDERKGVDADTALVSCTVEMMPLNVPFDVAVIDEIQMLGDPDRGWAWTQALLGVRAKELHVCGEARTVPLLLELAAACGDRVHVHNYERLTPLKMMSRSLEGNFNELRKGDCVVALSVVVLHSLRRSIEKTTGKRCAIIYGSLPPETRAQQARLFNDPDNDYDFLVASNAIGMGLNLSINRMVFQSALRHVSGQFLPLSVADIKQISGRAGRFSTAADDNRNKPAVSALDRRRKTGGLVTTFESFDFSLVSRAMSSEPEPIVSAGILPPRSIFERFARYFPEDTPFSHLIMQLKEHCRINPRLHMCLFKSHLAIADAIEPVRGLRIADRLMFCMSPINPKKEGEAPLACAYARLVAESRGAAVVDIDELDLEVLGKGQKPGKAYLRRLEGLHRGLIVFLWLSYRFTGIFLDRELAEHVKAMVEVKIEQALESMAFDYAKIRRIPHETARGAFQDYDEPTFSHDDGKARRAGASVVAGAEPMAEYRDQSVATA